MDVRWRWLACGVGCCFLGACQLTNGISVCGQTPSPELDVNRRTEGNQLISSSRSVAALPSGDGLALWTSDLIEGKSSELRAVRINAEGISQPGCARLDGGEDTLAGDDPASVPLLRRSALLSPPLTASSMGLVTFFQIQEGHPWAIVGSFFHANGCVDFLVPASERVFPIVEAEPGHILQYNVSVAVAPDDIHERYAVFWGDVEPEKISTTVKGRLVSRNPLAPAFPPSAADATGSAVTLPVRRESILALDATAISQHEIALITVAHSIEAQAIRIWLARFDDRLSPRGEPVMIKEAPGLAAGVPLRQASVAYDGSHLYVVWTALDGTDVKTTRLFGQAFDAQGRPAERPLRLGVAPGASDSYAALAARPGGGFVAAWRQQGSGGLSLRMRVVDSYGRPVFTNPACDDQDFPVTSTRQGDLAQASLAFLEGGSLLVAWDGKTPGGRDPDGNSVRSRLFRPSALFPGGTLRESARPTSPPPTPPVDQHPDQRPCHLPEAGTPGAACNCDLSCANDAFCAKQESVGDPGGTCYIACKDGTSCPAGTTCTDGAPLCTKPCHEHADCPAGRECFAGGCVAFCKDDSVCGGGTCDIYTRRCAAQAIKGAGLYGLCRSSRDCRSESCGGSYPEEGRCWTRCWPSLGGCPEGGVCIEWLPGGKDWGSCFLPCADGHCPDGLTCERLGASQTLVCTAGRP